MSVMAIYQQLRDRGRRLSDGPAEEWRKPA
jgi:hypothetical protein